jgi:hypothetical protein
MFSVNNSIQAIPRSCYARFLNVLYKKPNPTAISMCPILFMAYLSRKPADKPAENLFVILLPASVVMYYR